MILLTENILENPEMNSEQIASLQPALAKLLEQFRPFFERHKTFRYLEKYGSSGFCVLLRLIRLLRTWR
ncbi:MAG TPA: hypothetical protein VLI39_03800 [Sedimentisphaerales bacterium]|nr:hypothetical protein [Sedimentisphaerales bacterium]